MNADDTSTPIPTIRALGLDAGGTHTRWALADRQGRLLREGQAASMSGAQLHTDAGRALVLATLQGIAHDAGPVQALLAGVTGFDAAQSPLLAALAAAATGLPAQAVTTMSDIELACHAAGDAIVVYAGTGSIAAFIDASGQLQRAGGRGAVIDDAGGGHWIARQALRLVWRDEDEHPGAWRSSPLAQALFERIGGADWALTRQWVYGATRGELGTLALAVAAAADHDTRALALLQQAGAELARLALALLRRHGARALVLAGRVFELHPAVEASLRAALAAAAAQPTELRHLELPPHHAAARLAAARAAARPATTA